MQSNSTNSDHKFFRVDVLIDDERIVSHYGAFRSGDDAVDCLYEEGDLYDWAEITLEEYVQNQ